MTQSTSNSSLINEFDLEKVSDVVSKATFFKMTSSCKSKGQKNAMLTLEYLYYVRHECSSRKFYGGSAAEGTNLEDCDIDYMIVDSNITACKERDQAKNIEGQFFILDTSVCRPGFARLIPVKLDPNIKTIFNDHGKTIADMLETIERDKTFLSNDKIVDLLMDFLRKTKTADTPTKTSRHGPSATAANIDTYGLIKKRLGASLKRDYAFGITLYEWPIEGYEWINRKRKYEWPSPEFIEKITKLKCHVVAVGDKMSPTSSLEWRVSFLLQERELVWNFNNTQLQCFILMKNILKKFLHPIAPEELSSYHMKTILLWQSENNAQHLWQPKNLLRCTINCLLFLKHCIEKRYLEHYIDRRKNLFSYRFENHIFKENMIKCIDEF
ncbi:cyclic GMP-AMP synthase-like receptor 1 [Mytilus edulis]|uniref:cyclic GMP-AMP synthase-like receptor 1 n=1 Tax=Mytilus edulis TaxID=6550 RepID=UPI0039F06977